MDNAESEEFRELMAAYFSDNTINDGVDAVVFDSSDNAQHHRKFLEAISSALAAAEAGDAKVASILSNEVGPSASAPAAAAQFLRTVLETYTRRFAAESGADNPSP